MFRSIIELSPLTLGCISLFLYFGCEMGTFDGSIFGYRFPLMPLRRADALLAFTGMVLGLILNHTRPKRRDLVYWGMVMSIISLMISQFLRS